MTEQTGRRYRTPEEEYEHQRELAQKRAAWERGREMKREAERISGLRQEMDAYRNERLRDWMEHGGSPESFDGAWPSMMKDYLDSKQIEREAEYAAKLAEAENQPHYHPGI